MRAQAPVIICLGDSLTAGYQSPTRGYPLPKETPYGHFLQLRLGAAARMRTSGVCGELTAQMLERFRRDVLDHHPYAASVLGGTNDLGWDLPPESILQNLVQMYDQAQQAGIRCVAMTVPSIRLGEGEHEHIVRRQLLNRLIQQACDARGMPCVDLFTATLEAGTLQLADAYCNDGLHLTTAGYELMATLAYDQAFRTWLS